MRLFVAILLSQEMTDALYQTMQTLRQHTVAGRFSRRENLHLTLAFIGETNRVAQAKQALSSVQADPFSMQLDGVGRFRRDGGDIVWAGLRKNKSLEQLAQQVQQQLRQAGFVLQDRSFAAHLTLGREVVLEDGFDLRSFGKTVPAVSMQVNRISLMKSERIQGKLTYTEIGFVGLNNDTDRKS